MARKFLPALVCLFCYLNSYGSHLTGGEIPEVPLPDVGSQFVYTIHPGETDTITLNFVDSIATDSVFANFEPATFPNVSYVATSSPGVGSGSATLIYSVPANFNLTDSPYINIPVFVHDNACDLQGYAYYNVLIYIAQPNADSVWPGDANGDHTVDMSDPLAISVAYGNTGVTRVGANLTWTPQFCVDWATNFVNGINHKNADCDGNGTVDYADTMAVTLNYGQTHPKPGNPAPKASGLPDLKFDLSGVTFSPGATVTVPLKLGDATLPMNNIYGVGVNIKLQGTNLAAAPSFSHTGSWIGTAPNALRFTKNFTNTNIDWIYSRKDHQNVSGQGTIGTMTFTVPPSANVGDMIVFNLGNSKIIDKDGNTVIGYNVVDDTAYVQFPVNTGNIISTGIYATIAPNPSKGNTTLQIITARDERINIKVLDLTGRTVYANDVSAKAGNTVLTLPAPGKGVYTLQLQNSSNSYRQAIKWIQE